MIAWAIRVVVAVGLVLGVTVGLSVPAGAATGPGSFTKITTPASDVVIHLKTPPAMTTFSVSGTTSNDVTAVDIDCIFRNGPLQVRIWASAVPVTAGTFSTTATIDNPSAQCRLRAVPTDIDPAVDYLGSFAGPIVREWGVLVGKDGSTAVTYVAIAEGHDALSQATDAGACGIAVLATEEPPGMEVSGSPASPGCAFGLPAGNLTTSGVPTGSSITVDGHNAYLPSVVSGYLRGTLALPGLTPSALTLTTTHASNGDIRITETAPLMRCSVGDTYPPTTVSCPHLVGTGVQFHRVLDLFRGQHQARVRDSFKSTNAHAHSVRPAYQSAVSPLPSGNVGFRIPGHGSAFQLTTPDQVVTGLGTRAATLLARNDRYAVDGDPLVDTFGFSWSRAPQRLQFSHTSSSLLAMPYVLAVPSGATAYVGFAESEHVAVSDATKLAKVATDEMVGVPTISSPAAGAAVHGKSTTVKGSVGLGANGLPTSVTVNGHVATLSTISATKRTYKVTFSEPLGKHTITVTAKDSAGNTRSRSIKITNV